MIYENMIPDPPEGFYEDSKKKLKIRHGNYILWKFEWYSPFGGKKERMARCTCAECGGVYHLPVETREYGIGHKYYLQDPDYGDIGNGDEYGCMNCGTAGNLLHITNISRGGIYDNIFNSYPAFINDKFCIVEKSIERRVSPDGSCKFSMNNLETYVFEDKKTIRLKGYEYYFAGASRFTGKWQQMARPRLNERGDIKTDLKWCNFNDNILNASTVQNAKLKKFCAAHEGSVDLFKYLKFFRESKKFQKIANLIEIGLGYMVNDIIEFRAYAYRPNYVNWDEKSPYKMMNLNREEARIIAEHRIDYTYTEQLINYRDILGYSITPDTVEFLSKFPTNDHKKYLAMLPTQARTLQKYLRKKDNPRLSYYNDYIEMAEKLGYDTTNPIIQYPKDLTAAHDRCVEKITYNEKEEFKRKFRAIGDNLSRFDYSDDEYLVRIAKTETELIHEGKKLKHCVGGYAETHCNGNSIFFIRHADTPDKAFYTLQVDIRTGRLLQLHDYKNEHNERTCPKEILDFIKKWLREVFEPVDLEELLKEQKTQIAV